MKKYGYEPIVQYEESPGTWVDITPHTNIARLMFDFEEAYYELKALVENARPLEPDSESE